MKILVVDDIKENMEVLKAYLADYPVIVDTAFNGREAMEMIEKNSYNLVLMDIRMPVLDGISATSEIRRKEQVEGSGHQMILAVTAHAFQKQKKKFLEVGFDGVLTKPFFKKDLIRALYKYADNNTIAIRPDRMGNKAIGFGLENGAIEDIPESLATLLPELKKTIENDISIIKEGLKTENYDLIYAKAHSLIGVSGMFGFHQMASLIADLSQNIRAGNFDVAKELVISLELYLKRLKKGEPAKTRTSS